MRRYRQRNKETIAYHKKNARLRRFGLEPEDLTRMLEEQDHKCAVCGRGPLLREGKGVMSAHLDHCHNCGKVRALVCKRCNALLGFIESDPDAFEKGLMYYVAHAADTKLCPVEQPTGRKLVA